MRKIRWQFLIVFLALVAIGLLLITQQPEVMPGMELPEEQPSQGGKYVEAIIGSPGRLNPLFDWVNGADREINRIIYSSMIKFDNRGIPYGDLVDSWGISQDGKTYNFLIKDALWHDGQAVSAEDISFTIELLKSPEIPVPQEIKEFWDAVRIEVLDDKLIQFQLPEPFAPFFDYLTFGILPEHVWSGVPADQIADSELNLSPIGSGSYRFDKFITQEGQITGVALTSFEQYFVQAPFIEKLELRYFPDSLSALDAYISQSSADVAEEDGKIMGIGNIPSDILSSALDQQGLNIFTSVVPRAGMILINQDNSGKPELQDLNLRQALYIGINRQQIVDQVLSGQAINAEGPIFPGSWAYYDGLEEINFDPDKATSILREAGYVLPSDGGSIRSKDGVTLEFELLHPDNAAFQAIAELIRENWASIGVKANLKAVPEDELEEKYLATGNYEMALVEMNGMKSPDPDPYPFWHQTQVARGQNYSGWNDRQASEYLERARTQVDLDTRANLYKNFQVRFMNELPSLPLINLVYSFGIDQEIRGITIGPLYDTADRFNSIYEWYILTSAVAQN